MYNFSYTLNSRPLLIGIKTRAVSERFSRRANSKSLDSYMVTDIFMGISFKINTLNFEMRGAIDNVFSEEYQVIERYPLPKRNYSISLKLTYEITSGGFDVK
jgi:outer membrane cobalamin receptor